MSARCSAIGQTVQLNAVSGEGTFRALNVPRSVPGPWLWRPMPSGFIVTHEREAISENATMSARSSAALLGMLLEAVGEHPELRTELAGMLRDEHPSASAVGFIDSPAAARRVGLHPGHACAVRSRGAGSGGVQSRTRVALPGRPLPR